MALYCKTGSYTGNGAQNRAITGIGFQPKIVFINGVSSSASYNQGLNMKLASMTDGKCGRMGENGIWSDSIGLIKTLDSDGFAIAGSSVQSERDYINANGVVYYWVALGGDDIVTGSYVGNGVDNRNITGIGFEPLAVFTMPDSGQWGLSKWASTGKMTDTTQVFSQVTYPLANRIQQILSDGFQI